MTEHLGPRSSARIAGCLYVLIILCGAFAEAGVRQPLFVAGDAAATAQHIRASAELMRWGLAADIVTLVLHVVVFTIIYDLFKIVDRRAALFLLAFMGVSAAVQASALLFHIAPLYLLGGGGALAALGETQLQALAYLSLRLQTAGYTLALLFFGCCAFAAGYLILKSSFAPRLLGLLMCLAGACYITNSFLFFVAPHLASTALLLPALLGEGGLALWFLVVGVNETKWRERAAQANSQRPTAS